MRPSLTGVFLQAASIFISVFPAVAFASGPDNTWYDGSGLIYPYCTTSADTGGGFGWQPELKGPNGGSCKILASYRDVCCPHDGPVGVCVNPEPVIVGHNGEVGYQICPSDRR